MSDLFLPAVIGTWRKSSKCIMMSIHFRACDSRRGRPARLGEHSRRNRFFMAEQRLAQKNEVSDFFLAWNVQSELARSCIRLPGQDGQGASNPHRGSKSRSDKKIGQPYTTGQQNKSFFSRRNLGIGSEDAIGRRRNSRTPKHLTQDWSGRNEKALHSKSQ